MELSKLYGIESTTRLYIGTYLGFCYTVNGDKRYSLKDVIQKNNPTNPISYLCVDQKNTNFM